MAGDPIKPKSAGDVSPAQRPPRPRKTGPLPEARSSAADDIAAFVAKARAMSPHRAGAKGRLVFALDATMSRQPTWDMACALQADMFREAASLGSLDIRLVYYRGLNECRATGWISDSAQLAKLMSKIDCQGGNTQIGKVLSEARREAVASAVRAVVFVGDAMEEAVDDLCAKAGELGLLKVPVFMFQEGHDTAAEQAFREIARLTGGAWCRFDPGAAAQLRELLRAAAAYAAGGREALLRLSKTGKRRRQADRPDEVIAAHGFCPAGAFSAQRDAPCFLPPGRLYWAHANPDCRRRRRCPALLAAADVSCGQSGRARARDQDRRRRGRAGGCGLYRAAGRTGGGDPARHLRRGPARLVAVRAGGFSSIGGMFGGGTQRSPGQASRVRSQFLDMSLDHDSGELSGQIVDGPHAGRSLDEFDLPQLIGDDRGLRRRERRVT